MRFDELELTREDWISRRSTPVAVTASELAPIVGVEKHDKRDGIFWQKLGAWSRGSFGGYAQFGLDAEPHIHRRVQKAYGRHVRLRDPGDSTVQIHRVHRWAQCTVDRFVGIHLGNWKIEWVYPLDFKTGDWSKLPRYVWVQMQWQMFVCDAPVAVVVLLQVQDTEVRKNYPNVDARQLESALSDSPLLFFPVERDEAFIREAFDAAAEFLHNVQQQRRVT